MNFRKFIILFLLLIKANYAQTFSSASDFALGNSGIANIYSNSFGSVKNPALSVFTKNLESGIYYTPGLYNLEELAIFGFSLNYPINEISNVAFSYYNNSFSLYKKNYYNLNFSYLFDPLFIPGFNIGIDYIDIKNYKSDYKIIFDFGLLSILDKNFVTGFAIKNLFKNSHHNDDNDITHKYQLGFSYYFDNHSNLNFSVEKELYQKVNFAAGVSIQTVDFFYLNIGYHNNPSLQNYGFTLFINNISLEYALSIHNILGNTHHISLFYSTDDFVNKFQQIKTKFLK